MHSEMDQKAVRHDRFFWMNNTEVSRTSGWYYEAREGTFGPFESRDRAERDLQRLITEHPWKRPFHPY